ncbi:MAG: MaoC/PaaZ C-terminal domain-containing protein [Deltaproteobacteria bacterium]|nr:MaoC/PaaZ C-terminal domain-containing protein [Deltaproteobacteria bacterium]
MISFDSVDVGDEVPALQLTLSPAEVKQYALSAHMPGGRFMSDEEARAEGLPGQIVPGNFSLALFARLLTSWSPAVRVQRLSATFRALVRPNVPLLVHGVVTEKHASDHGTFLECDLLLESAEGDRLVTGTATITLAA